MSAINLRLSPPTTYLKIAPGQTTFKTLTIEQTGTIPLSITPSLVDFTSDGVTGQPVLADSSSFKYVTISLPEEAADAATTSFTLLPGQKKSLNLKFTIPETAATAEYPLTVLLRAQPADASGQPLDSATNQNSSADGSSQAGAMIGSNLIVLITNSKQDASQITAATIKTPWFVDSIIGDLTFSATALNSGTNAGVASGSAVIKNWRSQVVAEFPIHPDMILAGTARQLRTAPLPTTLPSTAATSTTPPTPTVDPAAVTPEFSYNPAFLIGPYTVHVTLYSGSQTDAPQNVSVISKMSVAIPYSLLAFVMITLAVVAAYESKTLRTWEQKILKRFFPLSAPTKSDYIDRYE